MPVPNTIADLNQAAASNYPLGTDTVGPNLDDYLRAGFAFDRQLFDGTPWMLGSVAGTPDAITATSSVPFTAYVLGQSFKFIPTANNVTNAVTININGIGTKSITKNGSQALAPGDLVAGVAAVVLYDGTQCQLISAAGTQNATGAYGVRGLVGANNATTPNTKFDFAADAVTLKGVGRQSYTAFGTGAITNDIGAVQAAATANGRDQIALFSASSWIHFYFIWNGTTLATLSSLVAPATGPTLPTGYTHWAYIGAVRYDSTPVLVKTRFRGSMSYYDFPTAILTNGNATVETPISLTTFVPPNALSEIINVQTFNMTSDGSGNAFASAFLRIVTGFNYALISRIAIGSIAGAGQGTGGGSFEVPNIGQQVSYIIQVLNGSAQALTLYLAGYKNPNGGE